MNTKNAVAISKKQSPANSTVSKKQPTNEEIAARAYEIFLARDQSRGSELDDWFQAERELSERN